MNAKIISIIAYIAVALVVVGVIGFFAFFTNGFSEDFKSFYVEIDNEKILTTSNGHKITTDSPMAVSVKYVFANVGDTKSGYTVKVVPNKDAVFDFTVNGDTMAFNAESEFTDCFNIVEEKDSFTITPKGSLQKMLELKYPDSEVIYNRAVVEQLSSLFTLVITSYNGNSSISINFTVATPPQDITLDKEVIEF